MHSLRANIFKDIEIMNVFGNNKSENAYNNWIYFNQIKESNDVKGKNRNKFAKWTNRIKYQISSMRGKEIACNNTHLQNTTSTLKKKKRNERKEKTKLIVFFRSFRSQSSSISRLHTLSVTKMRLNAVEMRQFTSSISRWNRIVIVKCI